MKIPNSFKKAIKDTMYDKTVTTYSTVDTVDGEGWARKSGTTVVTGTFLANVHFDNFEKVQMDYGIKEAIDITITTDETVAAETIIGYAGKQYKVFRVITNDSHNLLVARKWLSKSSTLISA